MKIETAIKKLLEYYTFAKRTNEAHGKMIIQNPVNWALYETWKDSVKHDFRKEEEDERKDD